MLNFLLHAISALSFTPTKFPQLGFRQLFQTHDLIQIEYGLTLSATKYHLPYKKYTLHSNTTKRLVAGEVSSRGFPVVQKLHLNSVSISDVHLQKLDKLLPVFLLLSKTLQNEHKWK